MGPALTLNPGDNILQKFYQTISPKMKINGNILHTLIPIPFYMGGFQLKSLEMEQTIELISVFITSLTSNLPTKDLLIKSLDYTQLEKGLDVSLLL